MYLVKLKSKERNYFSIGKDYTDNISIIVHSDTLFSAICNNFRKLFGNAELKRFLSEITDSEQNDKAKFQVSSCFHYVDIYRDKKLVKTIYFLPRPLIKFPLDEQSQKYFDGNPKIFKKIEFISFEVFKELQQNKQISLSQFHIINGKYLVDQKDLESLGHLTLLTLLNNPDSKLEKIYRAISKRISIFEILDEQKVRISRREKESEPFTWSKMRFNTSKYFIKTGQNEINFELVPGYYFLWNYLDLDDKLINKLKASLRLIKDEGLGGKKSIGCGLVDGIEFIPIDNDFPYSSLFEKRSDGNFMNLSLVYPTSEDIQNVIFFNLFGRSGFVYSPETKIKRFNDIKFIEEGAIFDKEVRGKMVQVASEEFQKEYHSIIKNGIGFYLNIGNLERGG